MSIENSAASQETPEEKSKRHFSIANDPNLYLKLMDFENSRNPLRRKLATIGDRMELLKAFNDAGYEIIKSIPYI